MDRSPRTSQRWTDADSAHRQQVLAEAKIVQLMADWGARDVPIIVDPYDGRRLT